MNKPELPRFGLDVVQTASAISWLVGAMPRFIGREEVEGETPRYIWSWDNVDLYAYDNGNTEVRVYVHPSRAVSEQKTFSVIGYCRTESVTIRIN